MSPVSQSFWSSMKIELLSPTRRRTRIDLANAMFERIESLYNRHRRHSRLKYESPVTHKLRYQAPSIPA
ncbi:IS3 family transposase [Kocuria rosea]|uniref:IS3 family transposase n=1 Tax=Kocuria rosea TaxID=1275 RepID=UPI003BAEC671